MNKNLILTAVGALIVGGVAGYGFGMYQNQENVKFDTQSVRGGVIRDVSKESTLPTQSDKKLDGKTKGSKSERNGDLSAPAGAVLLGNLEYDENSRYYIYPRIDGNTIKTYIVEMRDEAGDTHINKLGVSYDIINGTTGSYNDYDTNIACDNIPVGALNDIELSLDHTRFACLTTSITPPFESRYTENNGGLTTLPDDTQAYIYYNGSAIESTDTVNDYYYNSFGNLINRKDNFAINNSYHQNSNGDSVYVDYISRWFTVKLGQPLADPNLDYKIPAQNSEPVTIAITDRHNGLPYTVYYTTDGNLWLYPGISNNDPIQCTIDIDIIKDNELGEVSYTVNVPDDGWDGSMSCVLKEGNAMKGFKNGLNNNFTTLMMGTYTIACSSGTGSAISCESEPFTIKPNGHYCGDGICQVNERDRYGNPICKADCEGPVTPDTPRNDGGNRY